MIKAERVSKRRDSGAYCRPSKGYSEVFLAIDVEDYEDIDIIEEPYLESDETWPKGAPIRDYVKVGSRILKRRS